ncbi:MAG: hypothetical protein ABIA08_01730 [bacterium]
MLGYFDQKDGNPKIVISIKGTRRISKQIPALFDTGHTGSLSLPIIDLVEIGAKLSGIGQVTLADGNTKPQLYFSVKVMIDNIEKEVEAALIENPEAKEAIAGLELFAPYLAIIDFNNKILRFVKSKDEKTK